MQEFGSLTIYTANSVKYKIISISECHSRTIIGGSQRPHVCQDWVLLLTKQKSTPTRIAEPAGGPTSQKTVYIYQTTRCQFRLTQWCTDWHDKPHLKQNLNLHNLIKAPCWGDNTPSTLISKLREYRFQGALKYPFLTLKWVIPVVLINYITRKCIKYMVGTQLYIHTDYYILHVSTLYIGHRQVVL